MKGTTIINETQYIERTAKMAREYDAIFNSNDSAKLRMEDTDLLQSMLKHFIQYQDIRAGLVAKIITNCALKFTLKDNPQPLHGEEFAALIKSAREDKSISSKGKDMINDVAGKCVTAMKRHMRSKHIPDESIQFMPDTKPAAGPALKK